jgi:putative transposase
VIVHAADIEDADGAGNLLRRLKRLYPWLRAVFADSVYHYLGTLGRFTWKFNDLVHATGRC